MAKFSFRKRLQSFKYAFNGLKALLQKEHNAWIHLCATMIVIAGGIHFGLNAFEWIAITISIVLVFSAELFNTAIEEIADYMQPNKDHRIGLIKDLAAGGVLIIAIGALIVGLIIFLPKIF